MELEDVFTELGRDPEEVLTYFTLEDFVGSFELYYKPEDVLLIARAALEDKDRLLDNWLEATHWSEVFAELAEDIAERLGVSVGD
jgi:hypothetical protein